MYDDDVRITDLLLFDLVLYNDIMLMVSARPLRSRTGGGRGHWKGLEKAREHRGTSTRVRRLYIVLPYIIIIYKL